VKRTANKLPTESSEPGRREQILSAALGLFLRFGYKKTSMDDVARSLELSRQALYLYFNTKEELFRASLHQAFEVALHDARRCLVESKGTLSDRLVAAYGEWFGRYIGLQADVQELSEASRRVGPDLTEHAEQAFLQLMVHTFKRERLPDLLKRSGVRPLDVAMTLDSIARGLKHQVKSREEFSQRLRREFAVVLAPYAATEK
jgi:TetR/AcrR family transcriptional regulator, regulator of autoinduction and epiphytic fitness